VFDPHPAGVGEACSDAPRLIGGGAQRANCAAAGAVGGKVPLPHLTASSCRAAYLRPRPRADAQHLTHEFRPLAGRGAYCRTAEWETHIQGARVRG